MIPRFLRLTYWILAISCLVLMLFLIRGCARNAARIAAQHDSSPIPAPSDVPDEMVSVALANDADGSISFDQQQMALPPEGPTRARALLAHVLGFYAQPASLHPLPGGEAVADVYFVPLPLGASPSSDQVAGVPSSPVSMYGVRPSATGAQMAVVDLQSAFADAHPSGIEAEDLTLRSLISTLHANFPQVEQVRFLVDGKTRESLAGHADLGQAYPAAESTRDPIHILAQDGSRM